MKLLIIEDEPDLSYFLTKMMTKKKYAVDNAYDGEEALYLFEINEYDGIILDLNLPKIDGLTVLKKIREKNSIVNILILSARGAVEERIKGLDLGANDYLAKPFDIEEVDARMRALLRRKFELEEEHITVNQLTLNLNLRRITYKKKEMVLTPKEYGIIEYLMRHRNEVVSSEKLFEHVWDSESDLFSNGLKFHMYSLRKKIEQVGLPVTFIQTIRGQGYLLEEKR